MFKNYAKVALRSLFKQKGYSAINILGLTIGMTVFLLIAQYVKFEYSYENFIPQADHIYRIKLEQYINGELQIASAENFPAVGPVFTKEFPEITDYARLYNLGYKNNVIITNEDARPEPIAFKHRKFLYADSSFLPLMGYNMVAGDPKTALAEPLTAVISEEYAQKYFGDADPMGQSLHMQDDDHNDELVTITGVFEDLPANTHLKFDVLFSYKTLFSRFEGAPQRYDQSWRRKDMYTFVKVRPGTDIKALEAKFPAMIDQYNPELKENNRAAVMAMQPLQDIHLTSDLAEEAEANGDSRIVLFMAMIGLFVMAIAWINYINLSTARAMERGKEVGVRKVVGAFKRNLVGQFMVEAALVNLIAVIFTWGGTLLMLPYFNTISGLELTVGSLTQPWFLGLILALWLVGTLLSGFYPALVLSSFQPVSVLKGALKNTAGGVLLRKGLVVVQFIASVVLIIGTITVYRQLNFMLSQDIGVNVDQVLVVERPGIAQRDQDAFESSIDVFRAELKNAQGVKAVSTSVTVPGKQREYKVTAKKFGADDADAVTLRFNSMDYYFIDVFGMELLAGRAFSGEHPSDLDTSAIITESASRLLGFEKPEDAIGQPVAFIDFPFNPIVVGVVNDYHQVSLKKAVDPSIFYCTPYYGEFYSMRIETNDLTKTIAQVKRSWETAFPGNPFDHFFLDDYFNRQYANERQFKDLSTVFAILAIIIGCLGLFGLSGYTVSQRTKEIGIRKVLGASVPGVVGLLSKDLLKLIFLSILIAIPIAWYVMDRWLESFAYRIEIGWSVFLLAGILTIFIATLTVSYQSIKAALANPVESLRTE